MRQYVIDQLQKPDHRAIREYLDRHLGPSGLDGLYWLDLEDALLTDGQRRHDACKPLGFALELEPERLVCELLIRTRQNVRCDCMAYANDAQRNWLIRRIDAMLADLGLAL